MPPLKQFIDTHRRMQDLIDSAGLPKPDRVEYGHQCVRLLWWEQKLMVVIDLEGDPDAAA
jgi:hypothetical protein